MENTFKKIAVVVDSSADITSQQAHDNGLFVIRMPLTINEKQYIEFDEISDEEIIDFMKQGEVVKTSSPLLGEIYKTFEKILLDYDELIFIPLSSKLSSTYQNCAIASESFDGRVVVVDALSACAPIQVIARYAQEMIKLGYDSKEIKSKIENESYMFASLIPEDLVYLKRGGRISAAAAALANALKIVPILKVEDGQIDVYSKVRTRRKAISVAMEATLNVENQDDYEFMFVYAGVEDINEYVNEFQSNIASKVLVCKIKAVVMAHTGPGTIGFARIKKIKY